MCEKSEPGSSNVTCFKKFERLESPKPLKLNFTYNSPDDKVNSPVTCLSLNLSGLSTTEGGKCHTISFKSPLLDSTPKRRISWSSNSDTPINSILGRDIGKSFHDDSMTDNELSFIDAGPSKLISPTRSRRFKHSNYRRSQSFTMVQFDTSGGSPIIASKGITFGKENIPSTLDSAGENATHCFPSSPYKLPQTVTYSAQFSEESRDSQDSGYSGFIESVDIFSQQKKSSEKFVEKKNVLTSKTTSKSPKKQYFLQSENFSGSNRNENIPKSPSPVSIENSPEKKSFFFDDGFSDFTDFEKLNYVPHLQGSSSSMSSLLCDPLTMPPKRISPHKRRDDGTAGILRSNNANRRCTIRRCLSMNAESEKLETPNRYIYDGTFQSPSTPKLIDPSSSRSTSFKRPDPPSTEVEIPALKRRKSMPLEYRAPENAENVRLQRSHSETDATTIMKAVQRSYQHPDLIGDFSRTYILPLTQSRNQDVKAVSPQTVSDLIEGKYEDEIDEYVIVDCRYPYEYQGGHIEGAKNIYTKETILKEFLPDETKPAIKQNKKKVIIFHCEFSSERAPNMYRFLRNKDRNCNKECYPNLHHPELYVLQGGYKAFFETQKKKYCVPREYKPMVHKDHEDDLKHFRAKSKSWNGDCKSRIAVRPGLKF